MTITSSICFHAVASSTPGRFTLARFTLAGFLILTRSRLFLCILSTYIIFPTTPLNLVKFHFINPNVHYPSVSPNVSNVLPCSALQSKPSHSFNHDFHISPHLLDRMLASRAAHLYRESYYHSIFWLNLQTQDEQASRIAELTRCSIEYHTGCNSSLAWNLHE